MDHHPAGSQNAYRHAVWSGEQRYAAEPFTAGMTDVVALATLARRLPKADLHYHFAGTLRPSRLHRALAARAGQAVTRQQAERAYDFVSMEKFFDDLDRVAVLWGDTAAVTEAALDSLMSAYDVGARHVELLCVPDLHRAAGLTPATFLRAVAEAFTVATDVLDMTGGIVIELNRHLGADAAVDLVTETLDLREQGLPICGYGNSGDDWKHPFAAMAPAYAIARVEGFRLTGHANSQADVAAALDMGLDRLDHGWTAAENDALFQRVVDSGVGLTLCPSARLASGSVRFTTAFERLRHANVPIAIGTDDPPLFFSDLAADYTGMATECGWTAQVMADLAMTSLELAWTDPNDFAARRTQYQSEISALLADVCAPPQP